MLSRKRFISFSQELELMLALTPPGRGDQGDDEAIKESPQRLVSF
jgi:hypothetical protein